LVKSGIWSPYTGSSNWKRRWNVKRLAVSFLLLLLVYGSFNDAFIPSNVNLEGFRRNDYGLLACLFLIVKIHDKP
jgi:hypothetical protein